MMGLQKKKKKIGPQGNEKDDGDMKEDDSSYLFWMKSLYKLKYDNVPNIFLHMKKDWNFILFFFNESMAHRQFLLQ